MYKTSVSEQKEALIECSLNQLRVNLPQRFSSVCRTEMWVFMKFSVVLVVIDCAYLQLMPLCVCVCFSTGWWLYQATITFIWISPKSSLRLCPTSCEAKRSHSQPATSYKTRTQWGTRAVTLTSCCTADWHTSAHTNNFGLKDRILNISTLKYLRTTKPGSIFYWVVYLSHPKCLQQSNPEKCKILSRVMVFHLVACQTTCGETPDDMSERERTWLCWRE